MGEQTLEYLMVNRHNNVWLNMTVFALSYTSLLSESILVEYQYKSLVSIYLGKKLNFSLYIHLNFIHSVIIFRKRIKIYGAGQRKRGREREK